MLISIPLPAAGGDFESWSNGIPTGWSTGDGGTVSEVAGWDASAARVGKTASASLQAHLGQSLPFAANDSFGVSFEFAQEPSGTERGLNVTLRDGSTPFLSLRVAASGAIELYDGGVWQAVSPENTVESGPLPTTDPSRIYRLTLEGSLTGGVYTLRLLRLLEEEVLVDLNNLSFWQSDPAGKTFNTFRFERGRSGGDVMVDNVTYPGQTPPAIPDGVHPFLLFTNENLPELRAKADRPSHAAMKVQALDRAANLRYDPDLPEYRLRALRLKEVVNALALASFLDDQTPPAQTAALFRDQLVAGLTHLGSNRPGGWDGNTPMGSLLFDAVLALDVMHPHLTPEQRTELETLLGQWIPTISGWDPSPQSVKALWALYRRDSTAYASLRNSFLNSFFGKFTADGVAIAGTNYALARMGFYDREQKHLLLEIIRRHDGLTDAQENQIQNAYEWLYGYAMGPHGWNHVFGDSSPNRRLNGALEYPADSPTAAYLASALSADARAYANRNLLAPFPAPSLMAYVHVDPRLAQLPDFYPSSRIFQDGGAWLQGDHPVFGAMSAAMWNSTRTEGHTHKETNAISLGAYGELLLSNAGYAGWGSGALGFSWDYINNRAVSGNTVLIDYPLSDPSSAPRTNDHDQKRGNGIESWSVNGIVDTARGDSGPALPNGTHHRTLMFVNPAEDLPGYYLVFDEVQGHVGTQQTHAAWHPFATQIDIIDSDHHYRATCQQFSETGVDLHLLLTTPAAAVQRLNGLIAQFNGLSFVGEFLYPGYPLNAEHAARFGTVLYPHTDGIPLPAFTRESGAGYHATRLQWTPERADLWVVTTTDSPVHPAPGISFQGKAAWFRLNQDGSAERQLLIEAETTTLTPAPPHFPRLHLTSTPEGNTLFANGMNPALGYQWKYSKDLKTWYPFGSAVENRQESFTFEATDEDLRFYRLSGDGSP